MTPYRSHAPLAREVADIFIPLARNKNSAMTVGDDRGRQVDDGGRRGGLLRGGDSL